MTVTEIFISVKTDFLDSRLFALIDLKDKVNPVLRKKNNFRFNSCRETATAPIHRDNALHIILHPCTGIDNSRSKLNFRTQRLIFNTAVSLKCQSVDNGVFNNIHNQNRAILTNGNIRKQTRIKERLERAINTRTIIRRSGRNQQIGFYRVILDPLVSLNPNFGNNN